MARGFKEPPEMLIILALVGLIGLAWMLLARC